MSKINLKEIIAESFIEEEAYETQSHLHRPGFRGGSDLWACVYKKSRSVAGLEAPKKTGLKAEMGAMIVGKLDHKIIQDKLEKWFHENSYVFPDNILGVEVYELYDLIPGVSIESPIDLAIVTPPGIMKVNWQFKNVKREVSVRHPRANFEKIWDIKTINSMGYWSKKFKKEISKGYKAQMHGYMFATRHCGDLKEITMIFVNKETFEIFEIDVPWDQTFWDSVLERNKRIEDKAAEWQHGTPSFAIEDLFALDEDDNFKCNFCPYSVTRDVIHQKSKPRIELVKPCPPAAQYLRESALSKFVVGARWKRGNAYVDILSIKGDIIESINTGNRKKRDKGESFDTYKDSIYAAEMVFERLP